MDDLIDRLRVGARLITNVDSDLRTALADEGRQEVGREVLEVT
jgi:hypothetical protein